MTSRLQVAVIGGGWAGLAAAVEATQRGHAVTLYEMASRLGGRSRGVERAGLQLDNGQHILIGAYVDTLRLMRTVGVDVKAALLRMPLQLIGPDGAGLHLRNGPPAAAFAVGVLRQRGWTLPDRLALLWAATGWAMRRFGCDPALTVAGLTAGLPSPIRTELVEPLCVAALNTPASEASAQVFLQVLRDALFAAPGSADLLLPRTHLSDLFPEPAQRWLAAAGATLRLQHRVKSLSAHGSTWQVDGIGFDRVVLAATPVEAARLAADTAPGWASDAGLLRFEPIVTVYLRSDGTRLPAPMLVLRSDDHAPAQFVFDRGQLGGPCGLLALVVSGAQPWIDRGLEATTRAAAAQTRAALGEHLRGPLTPIHAIVEKRATFRCTPALQRPCMQLAPGLLAAGDYIAGPYPATLEGAVRSGMQAAAALDEAA